MDLTEAEKEDLRKILVALFGQFNVENWGINYQTLEQLTEMISTTKACSRLIDLVPRPAGWMPGVAYIRRELRNIARRMVSNKGEYQMCINAAYLRYRRQFDLLGQGIR